MHPIWPPQIKAEYQQEQKKKKQQKTYKLRETKQLIIGWRMGQGEIKDFLELNENIHNIYTTQPNYGTQRWWF